MTRSRRQRPNPSRDTARDANAARRAKSKPAKAKPAKERFFGTLMPLPKDRAQFPAALHRRILTFAGHWRRCRDPACRRFKRCAGPDFVCERDFPAPPMTEEEDQRMRAELYRELGRRLAAIRKAKAENGGAVS